MGEAEGKANKRCGSVVDRARKPFSYDNSLHSTTYNMPMYMIGINPLPSDLCYPMDRAFLPMPSAAVASLFQQHRIAYLIADFLPVSCLPSQVHCYRWLESSPAPMILVIRRLSSISAPLLPVWGAAISSSSLRGTSGGNSFDILPIDRCV